MRLCCHLPFGGVHVKMKYRLGSVLEAVRFVRPLWGLPGTAGALPLNFPFRHPAAVIIGIHFPLRKIPPFPSATVPPKVMDAETSKACILILHVSIDQ